jgi:hypothetical protein
VAIELWVYVLTLLSEMQAFVDASGRHVIVTASSGDAPYDLKIWSYQPPKVCICGSSRDILILNSDP